MSKGAAGTAKLRDHPDAPNAWTVPVHHYDAKSRTGESEWVDAPLDVLSWSLAAPAVDYARIHGIWRNSRRGHRHLERREN